MDDFSSHPFADYPLIHCEYDCSKCRHSLECTGPQSKRIYEVLMSAADGSFLTAKGKEKL